MSITDELREWAKEHLSRNSILAIADRIDAEHQKALDEWKAEHGKMWLKGYAECHAELLEGNETLASDLEGCGWIRLPKDADGVPIHVGDVMEERSGHTFEVASLMAFGGSENWLALSDPRNFSSFREPHDIRHYHAPTVEDVLQKLLEQAVGYSDAHTTVALNTIAEYAAKLRLAEEDA